MSEPSKRERPPTLKEERARSEESACWENFNNPAIVRFQLSNMHWLGVPFSSVSSTECIEREDGSHEMGIEWKDDKMIQRIFITGPKVHELYAWFCLHLVSVVRPDGKDITRVALLPPQESVSL